MSEWLCFAARLSLMDQKVSFSFVHLPCLSNCHRQPGNCSLWQLITPQKNDILHCDKNEKIYSEGWNFKDPLKQTKSPIVWLCQLAVAYAARIEAAMARCHKIECSNHEPSSTQSTIQEAQGDDAYFSEVIIRLASVGDLGPLYSSVLQWSRTTSYPCNKQHFPRPSTSLVARQNRRTHQTIIWSHSSAKIEVFVLSSYLPSNCSASTTRKQEQRWFAKINNWPENSAKNRATQCTNISFVSTSQELSW